MKKRSRAQAKNVSEINSVIKQQIDDVYDERVVLEDHVLWSLREGTVMNY